MVGPAHKPPRSLQRSIDRRFRVAPRPEAVLEHCDFGLKAIEQADANAIAVVRGEPSEDVTLTKHDHRALKRFGETANWLSIELVDYLVFSTRDDLRRPLFSSWRAAGHTLTG